MNDINFKAISFIENGQTSKGYFFFDAPTNSDYDHIMGIKHLTLPVAVEIMKAKGVDVIKEIKWNIKAYPGP